MKVALIWGMSAKKLNPLNPVAEILSAKMALKKQKNSAYSTRAFARDLGISAGFLSHVLSGRKNLSVEKAKLLLPFLNLTETERRQFLKAVLLSSVDSAKGSESHRLIHEAGYNQDYQDIELDRFQYFNNWYHVAIADLTQCSDFKPELTWIAERLGLDIAIVKTSVERLLRLGVIERQGSTYKKTHTHVSIPTTDSQTVIRNFHGQMIEKAKHNLEKTDVEEFKRRHISGITFTVSPDKIEQAKERIAAFKREMADLSDGEDVTELYQMNVQFFPLTNRREGK